MAPPPVLPEGVAAPIPSRREDDSPSAQAASAVGLTQAEQHAEQFRPAADQAQENADRW